MLNKKLSLKKSKGYFNQPKNLTKIVRHQTLKQSSLKQVPQFGFLNHNLLKLKHYDQTPENFAQAAKPKQVKQNSRFSAFNISELKFAGEEKHFNQIIKTNLSKFIVTLRRGRIHD
jgi:hypothetical protein